MKLYTKLFQLHIILVDIMSKIQPIFSIIVNTISNLDNIAI